MNFVSKLYIISLLYSFYYLIREVVFFEHLLGGIEAENANPAFTSEAIATSQVSATALS